ncbi:phosphoribosylamine--glycine ligase [Helicovermis profundi]|uniref:Phosphoribosylamine--glycine ligase n=1 Tax=Helicovermis profundi TaxID=3065157 RepID=A0AAU9EPQ2_9FIRM|nr:phosphoribosylamine--glycine ligase [Clostridia bacterium S502]
MKVLVIGSGGRESALVWKINQSKNVEKIYIAPGNGGTKEIGENVNIDATDIEALLSFALENKIDLTVVGPEDPLCMGIVDLFRMNNLKIIGPDKNGALLEGSKKFSKEFMIKYGIPTARFVETDNYEDALRKINDFSIPLVIKADGLAAGKGVIIALTKDEAKTALREILLENKFANAGKLVIIEEFLSGVEASIICVCDGETILPLSSARDYKRALDNDLGLNTGGMGAISPNPIISDSVIEEIDRLVLKPFIKGIKNEGFDFRGILFVGIMMDKDINVLEFNVRFGDPETEVILPRLKNDIVDVFMAIENKTLKDINLMWDDKSSCTVVLTSKGYPYFYEKGKKITIEKSIEGSLLFHAGTKEVDGDIVTNGGRVINVVSLDENLENAIKTSYSNIDKINYEGLTYRKDIGKL